MPLGTFRLNGLAKFTSVARTAKTVTAYNNAQVDTAQSKFGGASALFDGTDDYLQVSYAADNRFGTGDFTIECWVRPSTLLRNYPTIYSNIANSTAGAMVLYDRHTLANTKFSVYLYNWNSGALALTSTTTVSTNTWYHLAVVRNGTTVKLYVNGTEEASQTISASLDLDTGDTTDAYIGRTTFGADTSYNGHIDELRVSKVARYTANFTAPTAAFTNDSDTVMLIHANGTDGSTTFTDDAS